MLNSEHAGVFFKDLAVVGNWFADLTVEVETPKELRWTADVYVPQASEEIQDLYDLGFRTETLDKLKQLEFHSIICMEDGVTCLSIWADEEKSHAGAEHSLQEDFLVRHVNGTPTRPDDHGSDRVKTNADDFFLFSSNSLPSTVSTNWLRDPY